MFGFGHLFFNRVRRKEQGRGAHGAGLGKSFRGKIVVTGVQVLCASCDRIASPRFLNIEPQDIEGKILSSGWRKVKGLWVCPMCIDEPISAGQITVVCSPQSLIDAGARAMAEKLN